MITASVYGRLGGNPVTRTTASGKEMVTGSICVDVARPSDSEDAEWVSLVAFGTPAETLAKHRKGDLRDGAPLPEALYGS